MYQYTAKILDVIDGDTVKAQISLGCHVSIERPIRLYGINAPETRGVSREAGLASKEFLKKLIGESEVYLETFLDKNEKYGRLLGKLWSGPPGEQNSIYINGHMVSQGHATSYMV